MTELKEREPHVFIVFGGTGDLMRQKLLAAVYRLEARGLIHPDSQILATARSRDYDDKSYRKLARSVLEQSKVSAETGMDSWCDACVHYQSVGQDKPEDFQGLAKRIQELERERGLPGNRIFYLALPPQAFPGTIKGLGDAGLNHSPGWTRVVIEKPFGHDLASAEELNRLLHVYFSESQIYRIDHYLGKETVQNLLAFRFANPIFETIWNRDRVDHVQITVAEQAGTEGRATYYDRAGAIRDMVQNHLTQLLTLVTMEVPPAFDADAIRDEKVKVLRSIAPIAASDVVLGQYSAGLMDARPVPPYREERGVQTNSKTETFAALRLSVANWRWHGVPFYLRTGKHLPRRLTQIVVAFRRAPVSLFRQGRFSGPNPNTLVVTIQPDEGFELLFEVKAPGPSIALETQRLHFSYAEAFAPLADAYETLLLDIMRGDQTLFVRADEVEDSWKLYTPVLDMSLPVWDYPAGGWGPDASEQLLAEQGRHWFVHDPTRVIHRAAPTAAQPV